MKYRVIEDDEIYDDVDEAIRQCIEEDWHRDDDYFEDWVNDRYSSVEINGEWYNPYDILDNMDQGNLDDLRDEYCESENENDWDNARYEIEHGRIGDLITVHNHTIEILDDEDLEEVSDYDRDEHLETIEDVRARLKQENEFKVEQTIQTEKEEKDLMNMFQIVGE